MSAISLKSVEACFEKIVVESNEHVVNYEAPAQKPKPSKKSKQKSKKKPQGLGFGKYGTVHKGSDDESEEPIKPFIIMRASKTPLV